MRRRILCALGASIALACHPGEGKLAFVGGNVWDGSGTPPILDAVIIVAGDSIEAIGPPDAVKVPRGAELRRLDGKWIIPGLIDAHAHTEQWMLGRLLANGVTAVRDAGGWQDSIVALRDAIALGSILGPRLFIAGAVIDGIPPSLPSAQGVRTPVQARRAIDNRRGEIDASHAMISTKITRPILQALVDEAKVLRLPVGAHLGRVDAVTAARDGISVIEHLSGIVEASVPDPAPYFRAHRNFDAGWKAFLHGWNRLDSARIDRTARTLADIGVAVVPTLFNQTTFAHLNDQAFIDSLDLGGVPDSIRQAWAIPALIRRAALRRSDFSAFRRSLDRQRLFVRRFHAARGLIAAGSNTPFPLLAPGRSLHREIAALVQAGLSTREALQSATRNAAALLDAPELGTLHAGGAADFLVLNGNPLENIGNLDGIDLVIFRGIVYAPEDFLTPRPSPQPPDAP